MPADGGVAPVRPADPALRASTRRVLVRSCLVMLAATLLVPALGLGAVWWVRAHHMEPWRAALLAYELPESDQPPVRAEGTCVILPVERLRDESEFDAYGYPLSLPDPTELQGLLRAAEYARLDEVVSDLEYAAERDPFYESWTMEAFGAFKQRDARYEQPLDGWVQAQPDSAVALVARALYRIERGNAVARQPNGRANRRDWFTRAANDLDRAAELRPRMMRIYLGRMALATRGGAAFGTVREHFEAGRAVAPGSFYLYWWYLYNQLPRFDGSYEAAYAVAEEAQAVVDAQPRMRLLYGFIAADQASYVKNDWRREVRLANVALSYGDHARFYAARAEGYAAGEKWKQALPDVERALQLMPTSTRNQAWRIKLLAELGRFDQAKAEQARLEQRWPGDPNLARAAEYIHYKEREGVLKRKAKRLGPAKTWNPWAAD